MKGLGFEYVPRIFFAVGKRSGFTFRLWGKSLVFRNLTKSTAACGKPKRARTIGD